MESVSRRSFLRLATGLIASLPTLAGGYVLAPNPVFASEGDSTDNSELSGKESD